MKIVKLIAENIKRLHAVSITPDGALITIGGKNGQGKSSVLDSIAYAMGGEKLVPSEPIRAGEAEAKIVVDLGDLIVTRKFKREKIVTPAKLLSALPGDVAPETTSWGETTSTLVVTNKDGSARYSSPQAVLDRLLGKLTFDPLAFARAEPKEQDAILRKVVGLDVAPIEARRRAAFDQRAMLKKSHAIKEAQLASMPLHKDVPADETPMTTAKLKEAEELRKLAEEAEREVERAVSVATRYEQGIDNVESEIERIEKQIDDLQTQREDWIKNRVKAKQGYEEAQRDLDARRITAESARAVVPNVMAISQEMAEAEATNAKVRANKQRASVEADVQALALQVVEQSDLITKADDEKQAALKAAKFPVPGLWLSDDGVVFNGHPFEQAGSAEQIRVSVAIGVALNPQLKVLLIRNGNLLDEDSLKLVAQQAEDAGCQIWMEWVTANAEGVAVMMEDGENVGKR